MCTQILHVLFNSCFFLLQFWISSVCFLIGLMMEGAMAIIGLAAMSCVPDNLASSAHGLSCAFGQGKPGIAHTTLFILTSFME